METSVKNEGKDDNQSAFDEVVELECRPSTTELIYQQDSLSLSKILEEEIWMVILNKVKDNPEEAEACANATPYFRELLWTQRKEFLFPKVVDLLAVRNEEREICRRYNVDFEENEEADAVGNSEDEQEIPIGCMVWRKTVMECRLVCHAWNNAVEKCYQKSEMSDIPELVSDPDPRTRLKTTYPFSEDHQWTSKKYRILDTGYAHSFLDHFEDGHFSAIEAAPKNPFFSRFISIEPPGVYEGKDAYMAAITKILEMWGREIWYCYIDMETEYEEAFHDYRQLTRWLGLMPNLKYLKLIGVNCTREMTTEFFDIRPIPTLYKLEALDLKRVGSRIINQLLSQNQHISTLSLCRIYDIDEDVIRSLVKLKAFSAIESKLGNRTVEEYGTSWKLNKLTFRTWFPGIFMKAPHMFQCIQSKWSRTLTQLELGHPIWEEMSTRLKQSKSLRLDLPYLRSLKFQVQGSFFLDFILPSRHSLEHLTIHEHQDVSKYQDQEIEDVLGELSESEQIIEYVGFEERMCESNIWVLFPKLKTLFRNELLYQSIDVV